ncbi:tRNA (adenosine(37)-N6)-threonylcarbamoyltransferase complex ATPase subunit type 1 TsaE [Cyclobacteriaceae bacterium YHN15]|nr:tRNA (adenosine(37)-N6)-threonylcarbamoyltransferase complex ATPase subunit type 1 TsaE [Cyclobacteriaceae bacterium YHN15]
MKIIQCESLPQIDNVAKEVIGYCEGQRIWVFKGEMGAGKTTLIKAISRHFGIVDLVSSPTFSLVNEYHNSKNEVFYHFDFYRIEDPEEVLEIGIDEYLYSGNLCWLEWAEKIAEYLPLDFALISIRVNEGGSRTISLEKFVKGERNG